MHRICRDRLFAAAGDWLQGPYVYALYQYYGFSKGDIGRLFIAGFGASLLLGTIVGASDNTHEKRSPVRQPLKTRARRCQVPSPTSTAGAWPACSTVRATLLAA